MLETFQTFESSEANKWASIFGTQNPDGSVPVGSSVNTSEDPNDDGSFTETVGAEEFLNEFGGNAIKSPFQDGHYIYSVVAGGGSGEEVFLRSCLSLIWKVKELQQKITTLIKKTS